MRIAVTGCSGFVGARLLNKLTASGHTVVPVPRNDLETFSMSGLDAIVHCAAIAHRKGVSKDEYQEANHLLPVRIARRAAAAGVPRFVFVSTINVVAGNKGILHRQLPYAAATEYGAAKAGAEQALQKIDGLEVVIGRPCLVYGKSAPGNMLLLAKLASTPLPLPFGSAANSRSFVSIGNCVAALEFMATTPRDRLGGSIFHIADPEPVSTSFLISELRAARGRPPGLISFSPTLMKRLLALIGKGSMSEQLLGDLVVDSSDLEAAGFVYSNGLVDLHAMMD